MLPMLAALWIFPRSFFRMWYLGLCLLGPPSHWRRSPAAALANNLKAGKHPFVLLSVWKDGILETDSMRLEVIFLICPKEEEIGVLLDHSVGVTGEVALASELEPGACCPTLLDLGPVEEPHVLPGQAVAAMPVLVQRQHLGVHSDLSLLGVAALTQGSPLRGQLAAAGGPQPASQAEPGKQQRVQRAGGCGSRGWVVGPAG